ncbi:hypothetical protein SmaMPs15_000060 [Stenotrophomonas maltophilia phage vB_SmaM_Ps15]|uniref:Uncharacterized protein n=1 Tax=Stenotrophomonas maltophilia phage vB_SmaM_Ps15 TaxID=3071007 RepID=A0AAE9FGJ8_9CAUD|nr:hypothetical protein PQC01_gp060 [Stenotrophomonas maltophilia phage vB_SmaM_Ps15]UMO77211.1 hypothetical protein SmaMPs15_000060 [Stenotrophomonas maltophilia phage vB_SmaM_Ps15]
MRMYTGVNAKNRTREEDLRWYHGARWTRKVGIALRRAERQEVKRTINKEIEA